MTNAWALLYDELMTEHSSHYYEYDRNDPNRENPFEGNEIDLNLDALTKNGSGSMRKISTLKQIRDYLSSTYNAHYTSKQSRLKLLTLSRVLVMQNHSADLMQLNTCLRFARKR